MTGHKQKEENKCRADVCVCKSNTFEFIPVSDSVRQKLQLLSALSNHDYHVIIFSRELCTSAGESGLVSSKTICICLITMLIDCNPYQGCTFGCLK